ncbi:hypothetical protein ES754_04625 [Psychrobacter frigidicola]|uniref:Uncharacterized protein n=1 Tax=Psychrobacter frigidicola TaxID=45611 RepID=A0A5C7A6T2_9GAMM|nr:hypothetical protein [Psychrobacter frigidicola]TXD98224.1 hypothetical protein ES754_04625 [Psychrobacter frigidicola]
MRVKTAPRLRLQPARLSCHAPASILNESSQPLTLSANQLRPLVTPQGIISRQQGASTLVLALFVVAVLVTAIVAVVFGHKLGYQRGYYSLQNETKQSAVTSEQAGKELKELRIKNKILTNQISTAKQELLISLTNLDELRQTQQALKVESKQVSQLSDLYAKVITKQGGMPLQILGVKIDPLPENAFEFGFDVGMLSEDGQAKNLAVTLTLQDKDNFIEVPLEPANYAIEGIVRIRGRFVMPAGFKPLQVKLNLEAGDQKVEQFYDWNLGDMVDNMPLSLLDLPEVDKSPISNETAGAQPSTAKKLKP